MGDEKRFAAHVAFYPDGPSRARDTCSSRNRRLKSRDFIGMVGNYHSSNTTLAGCSGYQEFHEALYALATAFPHPITGLPSNVIHVAK